MIKHRVSFTIEGNIGSGKTTLLEHLKSRVKNSNVLFVEEPVHAFEKCIINGNSYKPLQTFYSDLNKYSFAFQTWVAKCYDNQLKSISKVTNADSVLVFDRAAYFSTVFIRLSHKNKYISDFEKDLLVNNCDDAVHTYFASDNFMGVNKIFYLDTPINVCLEQINIRDREGEAKTSSISASYLEDIDAQYKLLFDQFVSVKGGTSVLRYYNSDLHILSDKVLDFFDIST